MLRVLLNSATYINSILYLYHRLSSCTSQWTGDFRPSPSQNQHPQPIAKNLACMLRSTTYRMCEIWWKSIHWGILDK